MGFWKKLLAWLLALWQSIFGKKIVGITVTQKEKDSSMATCKIVKKTSTMKAAAPLGSQKLATGTFVLLDGGSGVFTTLGVDQSGAQVDISSVATETVVSDNLDLTVSPVTGMAVTLTAPPTGAGQANVLFTATWNDGSVGPFTFTASVTWSGGLITGITVVAS